MAQQSGRVCGFDSRYQFYLRSGPIVCVADLVALVMHFVAFGWHHRLPQRGMELATRLWALHVESYPIGVQAVGKLPLLRFILFTLAAVLVVKLLGCRGITWTQIWSYSYIVSYCGHEVLGIVEKWIERECQHISDTDAREDLLNFKYNQMLFVVTSTLIYAHCNRD
jgi:hypothetical protein